MKRNELLANRLREVLLNGLWIANTNFRNQILNIDWQHTIQKVGNLNTIAALTFHINYYLEGLLSAFKTGKLEISDSFSFDAPPITSDSDWKALTHRFLSNAEAFANVVENMDDATFDQAFIDPKYGTLLRNIEGVIEHSYYHLGQIVIIKKMVTQ